MRILLLSLFILLLSACGNQTIRPDNTFYQGLDQAEIYYQQHDYIQAAPAFEQLYKQYNKPEFAMYAADAWLQLSEFQKAQDLIDNINLQDNPLYQLVEVELVIQQGRYNIFLDTIDGPLRPRYLKIKAQLDAGNQNYLAAALALIELSVLDSINDYNNAIINNLLQIPKQQLSQTVFNLDLSELQQGWLEATHVVSSQDTDAIKQWKRRWYQHPANVFFLSLNQYNNIAILLPLSGRYKNIAKSIQQGMIAALYNHNITQQQFNFYDTGSNGESFSYAWYDAIESGAQFIIGPLEKSSIQQLKELNSASVPVLLLNQLDDDNNPFGFYQFALSQADEVSNVASRLIQENKKRIMLLAPESKKGRKLAVQFEQDIINNGGQIVSHAFYAESTHDYSREIKQALGLHDSLIRARTLQSTISTRLVNTPQIRPDIDAIFIIAKAKQARLIKPQLRFFQAEKVPVFATSQILSATSDVALNKDLNGITFPQSSFVIDPMTQQMTLNFDVQKININKKYFAFGYDAIALYPRLEWMRRLSSQKVQGLSGKLSVGNNGLVHRNLAWAQFEKGKAILLPVLPTIDENTFMP